MPGLESAVRRLALECANHAKTQNGIRDYCCLEWTKEFRCIFMISQGSRCAYFEKWVLPGYQDLQVRYLADRDGEKTVSGKGKAPIAESMPKRPCAICGISFVPASNRHKYCPSCRKRVRNEQNRFSRRKDGETLSQGSRGR